MNKKLVVAILSFALTEPALARGLTNYVKAGYSNVSPEISSNTGAKIDFEPGKGYNVSSQLLFSTSLGLRGSYFSASHDGGEVCNPGCSNFTLRGETKETRYGAVFLQELNRSFSVGANAGYEKLRLEIPSNNTRGSVSGYFAGVEGILQANQNIQLSLSGTYFLLESGTNVDFDGGEFRFGAMYSIGHLSFEGSIRGFEVQSDTASQTKIEYADVQATVGYLF